MSKERLLLFTFMQNDRGGARAWVRTRSRSLARPRPLGVCAARLRACPAQEAGWLRGPLARGCGWNVVPGARVLGGARPPRTAGRAGSNPARASGSGLMPPSVRGRQCRRGRGHAISVRETKCPRTVPLRPSGAKELQQPQRGKDPGAPVLVKKGGGTGAAGGRPNQGPQAAPRRAGWQADRGWSLWSLANAGAYCRGFSWA